MSSLRRYMAKKTQPQHRNKTATLNLRVDPKLKDAAEEAAAKDRRSLTSLIEKLLADYIKKAE
jgi:predicted HicB family RNase H-like nuclease